MNCIWKFENTEKVVVVSYMKRAQQLLIHTSDKSEKLFTLNIRESFLNVDLVETRNKLRIRFRNYIHTLIFNN